ncbi:MAG TPA: hypothetical protein VH210_12365 [Gaiellaceae bacterium]|nr:hypothetical protein [Gaiellaceae bacterium]
MADVSAPAPVFLRGSAVLDYWLVHAEGLTIQPLDARVEEVVVAGPVGHAEALIVRSGMTRRRTAIPAASIVAVEPSAGKLLMEAQPETGPRLHWAEGIVAARTKVRRGRRFGRAHAAAALHWTRACCIAALAHAAAALHWTRARCVAALAHAAAALHWTGARCVAALAHAAGALRWTGARCVAGVAHAAGALRWTGARCVAALAWSRPRALQLIRVTAQHVRRAATRTARGLVWLMRRLLAGARAAGVNAALLTLTAGAFAARGVARTAREVERVTALAVERGQASLEARRARRNEPTEKND